MEAERVSKREFFDEFGLEVVNGEVKVGETYPLFGMITKFLDSTPGDGTSPGKLQVELNYNIVANVTVDDPLRVELLRERAYESGIFVATVIAKEPAIEVNCQTIIFGKRQGYNA